MGLGSVYKTSGCCEQALHARYSFLLEARHLPPPNYNGDDVLLDTRNRIEPAGKQKVGRQGGTATHFIIEGGVFFFLVELEIQIFSKLNTITSPLWVSG